MAQRINRPATLPLADDVTVKEVFADSCAGLNVLNGNVHITFASVIADHSVEQAPSRRVVSARVVMPVSAATELRDLLVQLMDVLASQQGIAPQPVGKTIVTPLRKPN